MLNVLQLLIQALSYGLATVLYAVVCYLTHCSSQVVQGVELQKGSLAWSYRSVISDHGVLCTGLQIWKFIAS